MAQRLAELRRGFARTLPERFATARRHWDKLVRDGFREEVRDELVRTVHGLSGSGGSFGCDALSSSARQLEDLLQSMSPDQFMANSGREAERLFEVVEQLVRQCGEMLIAGGDAPASGNG